MTGTRPARRRAMVALPCAAAALVAVLLAVQVLLGSSAFAVAVLFVALAALAASVILTLVLLAVLFTRVIDHFATAPALRATLTRPYPGLSVRQVRILHASSVTPTTFWGYVKVGIPERAVPRVTAAGLTIPDCMRLEAAGFSPSVIVQDAPTLHRLVTEHGPLWDVARVSRVADLPVRAALALVNQGFDGVSADRLHAANMTAEAASVQQALRSRVPFDELARYGHRTFVVRLAHALQFHALQLPPKVVHQMFRHGIRPSQVVAVLRRARLVLRTNTREVVWWWESGLVGSHWSVGTWWRVRQLRKRFAGDPRRFADCGVGFNEVVSARARGGDAAVQRLAEDAARVTRQPALR